MKLMTKKFCVSVSLSLMVIAVAVVTLRAQVSFDAFEPYLEPV